MPRVPDYVETFGAYGEDPLETKHPRLQGVNGIILNPDYAKNAVTISLDPSAVDSSVLITSELGLAPWLRKSPAALTSIFTEWMPHIRKEATIETAITYHFD